MKKFSVIISILLTCCMFTYIVPVVSAINTTEVVMGDVNGDGVVMLEDALFVLDVSAGIMPTTQDDILSCDMDGDGVITIKDARLVLTKACDIIGFEEGLINMGFPKSYVKPLVELHDKHPDWVFVPFITGLDWQTSVNGERSPKHSKQLIEKNVDPWLKCSCSECIDKTYEGGGWVSASEDAIKYYMDPRNFLSEEYIFQFENIRFDPNQTIEGIESILSWTWMKDADITYYDAFGNLLTYQQDGKNIKYSEAIFKAAQDSNISAYYLASKIVQEVGTTNPSYVTTICGTSYPYNGIYNFYNIGAYNGAGDGLRYANGFMKTIRSTVMYSATDIGSSQVITIPASTNVYFVSDNDTFYGIRAEVDGVMYAGYVTKESLTVSTDYGRPWGNPYDSIYHGAKWIYDKFAETQFTGYLQKFNVNPESDTLYAHEYMANVRAAAAESYSTYNAYKTIGVLEARKTFSIPVFLNMPYADYDPEEVFQNTVPEISLSYNTADSAVIKWNAVEGAEGYEIYKFDETTSDYYLLTTTTETTYSAYTNTDWAYYSVRGYKNGDSEKNYTLFSPGIQVLKAPAVPLNFATNGYDSTYVNLTWQNMGADGYDIYRYDGFNDTTILLATTTDSWYTDYSVLSGTYYHYVVRSYRQGENGRFYSTDSNSVIFTTPGETPRTGVVRVSDYLNIRADASTSSQSLVKVYNGQKLTILETIGSWYKVQFILNGVTYNGYGHSDYIVVDSGETPPVTPEKEICPYTEPTVTLSQNKANDETSVKWLQWYLYKLGYLTYNDIDGAFGPTTNNAVRQFQTDKNLAVDGLVGSGTRAALKTAYGA